MILTACSTTNKPAEVVYIEVPVEVKLMVQPDKPEIPELQELSWLVVDNEYFALTPEDFTAFSQNLENLRVYIERLQEGWKFYEEATKPNTAGD